MRVNNGISLGQTKEIMSEHPLEWGSEEEVKTNFTSASFTKGSSIHYI